MKMIAAPLLIVGATGLFTLACCLVSLLAPSQKGQDLFTLYH
jgi:hypothetical protein